MSEENFDLFVGEKIRYKAPILFWDDFTGLLEGNVFLTNFRIVFLPGEPENQDIDAKETLVFNSDPVYIAYGNVEKLLNGKTTRGPVTYQYIEVILRQFANYRFLFESDSSSLKTFYSELQISPAFEYKQEFKTCGWDIYDPILEFQRMGIPNDLWRVTKINENFSLCLTYPKILAVPRTIPDDLLKQVAEFRSKSRLPVLSWVNPINQCSITRCSQPLTGIVDKRSKDDETYIEGIKAASPSCHQMVIFDARPKLNAVSNKASGGGYEGVKNYSNADILFMDIPNIDVMRESFVKLRQLCQQNYNSLNWFSLLEATKWLEHIGKILAGAAKIVEMVDRNRSSVIVHCSDGWDRTSQLTSLAMICLDPFYRTVIGFETLIEKEWCSFGHKFGERYGIGQETISDQRSPVFYQFLDCVWQIMNQYAHAFEFTENLLLEILRHMNSGLFGTFMFDHINMREQKNLREETISIWSSINSEPQLIFNPLYSPEHFPNVILHVSRVPHIKLWKACYFQANPLIRPNIDYEQVYNLLMKKKALCRERYNKLKAQIDERNAKISQSTGESEPNKSNLISEHT